MTQRIGLPVTAMMVCAAVLLGSCGGADGDLRSALRSYEEGIGDDERVRARTLNAIEEGADPNLVYDYLTPLKMAIELEDRALVAALIEAGANVNAAHKDDDGVDQTPPLIEAVNTGDSALVELLLGAGAMTFPNPEGESALGAAVYRGHTDIVDLLLQRDLQTDELDQALIPAAERGDAELFDRLLAAGATYDESSSMLVSAVRGGNPSLVKRMLVEPTTAEQMDELYVSAVDHFYHGLDMRPHAVEVLQLVLQDSRSGTPEGLGAALQLAVDARSYDATRVLLQHGAPPDGRQPLDTPLMTIARRGIIDLTAAGDSSEPATEEIDVQKNLAELLLKHGADVNRVDRNERSALIMAAGALNADLVELLLQYGADPSLVDAGGKTAKEHAIERKPRMPSEEDKAGTAMVTMFGLGPLVEHNRKSADRIVELL